MTQSPYASHWSLDPSVTFLNHGSFGACPTKVLEFQSEIRRRLERQPVRFFMQELEPKIDGARAALGMYLGCDAEDLAFVPNASTGVNTVLRSLRFEPGDELLTTNHAYNACKNALDYVAELSGARVVVASIPFPIASSDEVVEAIVASVSARTRLALVDHVTSPTALVFPIAKIVSRLKERGVDTLVDGAHAPGMLDLDLSAIDAAYYTGNCHKWMCAPKGAAFLHVRRDKQSAIHPLNISHGRNSTRTDRSRFRLEFDWVGTSDPTAFLCVPEAIRTLASMLPDGSLGVRRHMRDLAMRARAVLGSALNQPVAPQPDDMVGSMVAMPLPDTRGSAPTSYLSADPLQESLRQQHHIEVPVPIWPRHPRRLIRVSAALYNTLGDYERLAEALKESVGQLG